jgi:hypothetical protein
LVALQLAVAAPAPSASAAPTTTSPTAPAPAPSVTDTSAPPPSSAAAAAAAPVAAAPAEPAPQGVVPYVHPSPPLYAPPYPYAYSYAYPPPQAPPPQPPEPPTRWFARLALGAGPPAYSDETELLRLEGYGNLKVWLSLDAAYMLHKNVGLGAFTALSTRSSAPDGAPAMSEPAYFVGAEAPIKLGSRAVSVLLTPRVGYAAGQVQFTGDVPFQSALAFGVDVGVFSLKYHFGGSVGFLRAAVPPPGEVGRDHDYGGLFFMLGGILDG